MHHHVPVVPHINSECVIGFLQKTRKAQLCDTCIIPGAYQHLQGSPQQEERVKCLKLLYYSVVMCSFLKSAHYMKTMLHLHIYSVDMEKNLLLMV